MLLEIFLINDESSITNFSEIYINPDIDIRFELFINIITVKIKLNGKHETIRNKKSINCTLN